MSTYRIREERLPALFEETAKKRKLYLPTDTAEGVAAFLPYREGMTLTASLNTSRSAKDLFFPQTETLADFKVSGREIAVVDVREECEDFLLFGVRACDVKSFEILDRVFLAEPVDSFYKNRREHGTVVSLACASPVETCFCGTFGIDCADPEGDAAAYRWEGYYYFVPLTEKGEEYLASVESLLEETDDGPVWDAKGEIYRKKERLPLKSLTTEGFGGERTKELFDSEKWESLSEACLGCGTCTYVCPTCQCFDIRDFDTGRQIRRYRCWDSCMVSDFTKMAGGNPRPTQKERFRQRFMHKLVYFPAENEGIFGCVGCGRCLAQCPISMNIVKVMKALKEEKE